jgi:hypothetical protein
MRTVYAISLGLSSRGDALRASDLLTKWIENWYRRRGITFAPPPLDESGTTLLEPADGHHFLCSVRSASCELDRKLLEISWRYPDDYDKGLAWSIQVRLLLEPSAATITLQLGVFGTKFSIQPADIKLGPPKIVRDLTSLPSATFAGYPYSSLAETTRADAIESLCELLLDSNRPFPVVVVSHELNTERPLVDVDRLAAGTAGLMKVYELADKWAAYRLTEEIGKPLSCYAGAVRIYWPGLTLSDDPFKHPAWMPWQLRQLTHTDELAVELFKVSAEATSYRFFEPASIGTFRNTIEDEERQARRAESSGDADQLLQQLIEAEDAVKGLRSQLSETQTENQTLRQNLGALLGAPAPTQSDRLPRTVEQETIATEPKTVSEAVEIARAQFTHLIFLDSAIESAQSSPYRTPTRALEALQAIEEVASLWAAGLSGGKNPGPLKNLFRERGFEYKDDISQTSRAKWGEEYSAKYKNSSIDISPHITIGAKQADTCLSVHMYWDKESKNVVIAHVGRHKTNTKT